MTWPRQYAKQYDRANYFEDLEFGAFRVPIMVHTHTYIYVYLYVYVNTLLLRAFQEPFQGDLLSRSSPNRPPLDTNGS